MPQITKKEKVFIEKLTGELCLMTDVLRYSTPEEPGAILNFIVLIDKEGIQTNWICSHYEYIGDL